MQLVKFKFVKHIIGHFHLYYIDFVECKFYIYNICIYIKLKFGTDIIGYRNVCSVIFVSIGLTVFLLPSPNYHYGIEILFSVKISYIDFSPDLYTLRSPESKKDGVLKIGICVCICLTERGVFRALYLQN